MVVPTSRTALKPNIAMTTLIATSTAFVGTVVSGLYTGLFNLLYTVLPYAIGILVFYIGYRLARRALGGR